MGTTLPPAEVRVRWLKTSIKVRVRFGKLGIEEKHWDLGTLRTEGNFISISTPWPPHPYFPPQYFMQPFVVENLFCAQDADGHFKTCSFHYNFRRRISRVDSLSDHYTACFKPWCMSHIKQKPMQGEIQSNCSTFFFWLLQLELQYFHAPCKIKPEFYPNPQNIWCHLTENRNCATPLSPLPVWVQAACTQVASDYFTSIINS